MTPETAAARRQGLRGRTRLTNHATRATTTVATLTERMSANVGAGETHHRASVLSDDAAGAEATRSRTADRTRRPRGLGGSGAVGPEGDAVARRSAARRDHSVAPTAITSAPMSRPTNAGMRFGAVSDRTPRYRRFSTVREMLMRRSSPDSSGAPPSNAAVLIPASAASVAVRSVSWTRPLKRVDSDWSQPCAEPEAVQSTTTCRPGLAPGVSAIPATRTRESRGRSEVRRSRTWSSSRRASARSGDDSGSSPWSITTVSHAASSSCERASSVGT